MLFFCCLVYRTNGIVCLGMSKVRVVNLSVLASIVIRTVDPKVSFIRFKIDKRLTHTIRCLWCEVQQIPLKINEAIKVFLDTGFRLCFSWTS